MSEVRAESTGAKVTTDVVAHHAALRGEEGFALIGLGANSDGLSGSLLPLHPLGELGRLDDFDAEKHVGMRVAAELRALSVVMASLARLQPHVILAAGHEVDLASELGYPEGVDDVLGAEVDADGDTLGDHHLIRDRMLGVVGEAELRVFETEPPLLTDDVNLEHLLFDGLGVVFATTFDARIPNRKLRRRHGLGRHVVGIPNRVERRDSDDDERTDGSGDESDFDQRIAVAVFNDGGLVFIARTSAEFNDGVDEQAADKDEEDDDQPDGGHEDIKLDLGDRALGVQGRLADGHVGLGAAGHDDGQEGGGQQTYPTKEARKHKGCVRTPKTS